MTQKADPDTGLAAYNDKNVRVFTNIIRSLLVTIFPAVTMAALYTTSSLALKLPLVAIFAGIFTLLIALFTNARTVDLFVLTAT